MARTVDFEWGGKSYKLPVLLARKAPDILDLGEKMDATPKAADKFRVAIEIIEALGCPKEIMDNLAASEFESLMEKLRDTQMPGGKAEAAPLASGGAPSGETPPEAPAS